MSLFRQFPNGADPFQLPYAGGEIAITPFIRGDYPTDDFFIAEDETWAVQPVFLAYSDQSRLVLPEGFSIVPGTYIVSLTQNGEPSSPNTEADSQDELAIELNVDATNGSETISFTVSAVGEGVPTVPTARVAIYEFSVVIGSVASTIPLSELFEGENIVLSADNPPPGITTTAAGLSYDPAVMSEQVETPIVLRAQNNNPASVANPATMTVELTATASTISLSVLPTIGDPETQQIFVGEPVLEFTNRDAVIDRAVWNGLGDPGSTNSRLRRNNRNAEIMTATARARDLLRHLADGYRDDREAGDGLGPADATFSSPEIEAQNFLNFIPGPDNRSLLIEPNPSVPAGRVLRELLLNGRNVIEGLTRETFAAATQMSAITDPVFEGSGGLGLGDVLTYRPPFAIGPEGGQYSVSFDLIDLAGPTVLRQDVSGQSDIITVEIDETLQGRQLIWRAKYRMPGLDALDIDSAPLSVPAAEASYTRRAYATQGTSQFDFDIPDTPALQLSLWINPTLQDSGQIAFAAGNRLYADIRPNGSARFAAENTNDVRFFDFTTVEAITPEWQHLVFRVEAASGAAVYRNGVQLGAASVATPFAPVTAIDGHTTHILAKANGDDKLDALIGDFLVEAGTLTPVATLYNGGIPRPITSPGLLHIGGEEGAEFFNQGGNNGSAELRVSAGNLVNV